MPVPALLSRSLRFLAGKSFASGAPVSFTLAVEPRPEPESEPEKPFPYPNPNDDLPSRIFRLRVPKRSATAALDRWVDEGKEVTQSELRRIVKDLRKAQRYKHALEIMAWMESQANFRVRASDHGTMLDLIAKVHGLSEAEAYFDRLSASASQKDAAFVLLHLYVKEKDMEKAEVLMQRLLDSGLAVNPYLFNEMMKLYMAKSQYEKVLAVINHMKLSKIPFTVLSYSLWMNACGEISGAPSVEMVYKEMRNDKNIKLGWSTYATLANIYTKSGHFDKASAALKVAEQKLSMQNRLAYSFIMTSYASLKDRAAVLRVWESSKRVSTRMTCTNYMSVMLCLIKVGDINAAEIIFKEWESQCRNYDVRVSNVLLGTYMRNGWMDKAEAFHIYTMEKGATPNYKTWEILMEGWAKRGQMDKAVEAMQKGLSKLKGCIWRPPFEIMLAIAEYFERQGNIKDMRNFVKVLRSLGLMNLMLYKSALRAYIKADIEVSGIIEMMERDKVDLDDETMSLIQRANRLRDPDINKKLMHCPAPLESFFSHHYR